MQKVCSMLGIPRHQLRNIPSIYQSFKSRLFSYRENSSATPNITKIRFDRS
jgi:hypothetical protein